jgi:hypothetical protein
LLVLGTAARPAAADVAYRTEIVGIADKALASDLRAASQLVQQQDRKPDSALALQRRAEADR